jgi:hypothetical protein
MTSTIMSTGESKASINQEFKFLIMLKYVYIFLIDYPRNFKCIRSIAVYDLSGTLLGLFSKKFATKQLRLLRC